MIADIHIIGRITTNSYTCINKANKVVEPRKIVNRSRYMEVKKSAGNFPYH